MTQDELRDGMIDSLAKMYGMEAIAKLSEFWQGELRVLQYVFLHGDAELTPSVLSDALHVSRARITAALTSLRKKEYIIMEMCENDRRRIRVKLTDEGKKLILKKQKDVKEQFDELINGLGKENTMELMRLIALFIDVTDRGLQ